MSEFKLTQYRVRTGNGERAVENPFSAVFLSDLHNMSYGENNSILLQAIRNQNPAVVFVAGDMLTSTKEPQMEAAIALMDELTKKYPVYYANGNHEQRLKERPERYGESYANYTDAIRSFGVHLLENSCEQIELQRVKFTVWGYEIPIEYFKRGTKKTLLEEQMSRTLGRPDADSYNILLAHNPVYFETYAKWGADLTLSGHLHGGIVRLPFLGGLISPQAQLFPKYDRGMYQEDGKRMITGAGLGNHTIPFRINNPAELVVIDFV